MSEVQSGLEGVVAFATQIAEPDRDGGALRYRGVDIEELVGTVAFEQVWGLLVDGRLQPGLGRPRPPQLSVASGNVRVDVQAALAMLAAEWSLGQLIDIDEAQARGDLARLSAATLSFVAQSARDPGATVVSQAEIDDAATVAESFLLSWRGVADPRAARAIDAYWVSAAEHGMNASTFTARVVASTGADCAAALSAAVGALSGPLHGGAPSRVLKMLDEVEALGDAERWVTAALDRGDRLMGFGHRIYRVRDPRAEALAGVVRRLSRTSNEIPGRLALAEAVEQAALAVLAARKPGRSLAANVELYTALLLEALAFPPDTFTGVFAMGRVAGWIAHAREQRAGGRLIRPQSRYIGPRPREAA
jgi:citrate synthase